MKCFKNKGRIGSRLLGCSIASSFLFYSHEAMQMMIFLHDERDFKIYVLLLKRIKLGEIGGNLKLLALFSSIFTRFLFYFLSSFHPSFKIIFYMLVLLVEANLMSFILILHALLYVNALLESIFTFLLAFSYFSKVSKICHRLRIV